MDNSFIKTINSIEKEYYETHKKNRIFKSNQKKDCANMVQKMVSLDELLNKTAYILENTNKVYVDYLIFKTFATEETYSSIIDHIFLLFKQCIEKYKTYELHINLLSNTITACERYKGIFNYLTNGDDDNFYVANLSKLNIYNSPSTITTIFKIIVPAVPRKIKENISIFNKIESPSMIDCLHQNI